VEKHKPEHYIGAHISQYRQQLPQLNDTVFLTDGGMETTFVFHQKMELPHFASFDLLSVSSGRQAIKAYYQPYIQIALQNRTGFILESATWRANPDWGQKLGYSHAELMNANRDAIALLVELRDAHQTTESPMVISGCIGPRGDGYQPGKIMSIEQARDYHAPQVHTFADTQADLISAMTINYVNEAIGITLAAQDAEMPVVISFTTETDGRLPDGTHLSEAIAAVDAATNNGPVYYMINCAHPDHFRDALEPNAAWTQRIRSVRANASRKSHAELDESDSLDRGDPKEFGALYQELRNTFPQLTVLGGCCGTDTEHVQSIHAHCCVGS